ncbi:MAG: hypothetical protein E7014_05745 [Alphaproteobacteria bacterium]|nr:hypothetical protein [Alphaproteobacteria bacterium]
MADNKPVNYDAYLSRKEAEIQQESREAAKTARDNAERTLETTRNRYYDASDNALKDEYEKAQEAYNSANQAYNDILEEQQEAAQERIEEQQRQDRRTRGDLDWTDRRPEIFGGATEEQRNTADRVAADKEIENARREKEEAEKRVRDIQARLRNRGLSNAEREALESDLKDARDDVADATKDLQDAEKDKADILKSQDEDAKEDAAEKARMDAGNLTWWERNAPFEWMGRASDEQIKAYDAKEAAADAKEDNAEKARMDAGNLTWWERNAPFEWMGRASDEQIKAYDAKEREANIQEAKKKEAEIKTKLKDPKLSNDDREDLEEDLKDVRDDLQGLQSQTNNNANNNNTGALSDGVISSYERYAPTEAGGATQEEIEAYDNAESINIKGVSTNELVSSPVLRQNLTQIKKAQELAAKTDGQVDIQDYIDAGLRPELAKQVAREIYQANQTNDGTERPQAPKVADNSR